MAFIGARCHELRIPDEKRSWRIIYRTDPDAVVVVEVFDKRTRQTPSQVIENAKRRLREYDTLRRGGQSSRGARE
jgi:phage-related protein